MDSRAAVFVFSTALAAACAPARAMKPAPSAREAEVASLVAALVTPSSPNPVPSAALTDAVADPETVTLPAVGVDCFYTRNRHFELSDLTTTLFAAFRTGERIEARTRSDAEIGDGRTCEFFAINAIFSKAGGKMLYIDYAPRDYLAVSCAPAEYSTGEKLEARGSLAIVSSRDLVSGSKMMIDGGGDRIKILTEGQECTVTRAPPGRRRIRIGR